MEIIESLFLLVFNNHSFLFLVLLISNILDWLTGWAKARIKKVENSQAGYVGVMKKISIWIIVLVAFLVTYALKELGTLMTIDLSVAQFMGWFIVISLIFNELRSILENLVECDIKVPTILVKGLEIFQEKINQIIE